ncbi:hypothetical protein [Flavobacterium sp. LC2016-01]|uniref:hypothetical protein n=1 Tax=Flavobacterium sp. LC2016-01 TaxID=2675876 RepID=UPI0012BA8C8B|nr:hypothetical protein [Flavobacterium sp. LC2016-01]MTH14271.1 hypothetical protein [Flavobacterium sp. LC2016-01]
MKILKGCLITIIAFILMCIVAYYFYRNNVISNLESSSKNVEENWKKYTENINLRNKELILETINDDSLQHYLKMSKDIKKEEFSRDFEYIEYKINEKLMSENIENEFNEKLNSNVDAYNQSVRAYNVYRVTFPNSLIARKTNYPKKFKYFDIIRYGIENQNPKEKRQKIDHWIKNGGKYPE